MAGLHRPVVYKGHDAIKADIAHFKAALESKRRRRRLYDLGRARERIALRNVYYKSDEEFMYAVAEAMREEYKAIVDAGLILQLDDPAIAENWDMVNPDLRSRITRNSRWCGSKR